MEGGDSEEEDYELPNDEDQNRICG